MMRVVKRLLPLLLIVMALCTMGARELPRPCLGDGLGNACEINRCACTALCSCRSSCGMETSEASTPACHMHADADAPSALGHFSLPEPPPALLAAAPLAGLRARSAPLARAASPRYPPSDLLPPEPPPRRG